MKNQSEIILSIYNALQKKTQNGKIPVRLRPNRVVGTVQDDPFDCWIEDEIKKTVSKNIEVFHSGQLTTPDLVIRDKSSGLIIGLEIKKLIQKSDGKDPRGLTLDYNSSLPCGHAFVKVGNDTIIIPCYYLFALLTSDSKNIVTLIIVDGDFLNYDFDLYKDAKYSNFTEYNHGPYGEGSVRHRKMYTYPNPLNSKLKCFHGRQVVVLKRNDFELLPEYKYVKEQIERVDRYGNSFFYCLYEPNLLSFTPNSLQTIKGIFDACKVREPKERVAYIPEIPSLK